jgi:hypothetical protein
MNEFTKEELIDMHYAIRFFWKNRSSYDLPSDKEDFTKSYELMEKIGSMIHNHCEKHEADEFENHDICKHCDKRFR